MLESLVNTGLSTIGRVVERIILPVVIIWFTLEKYQ